MRTLPALAVAALSVLLLTGTSEAKRRRRAKHHRTTPASAAAALAPSETDSEPTPSPLVRASVSVPPATPAPAAPAPIAPIAPAGAPPASAPPSPGGLTEAALGLPSSVPSAAPPAAPPEIISAPPPVTAPPPPTGPAAPVAMKGKWNPVLYGFVELDALHDSTQSFQEPAGNGAIQRRETFAGSHGRTMYGVRNSRIGFKLSAPEYQGVRASAILEMDFLGNQPANPPAISEVAFFSNPAFRVRHFALKVESHYVDLLFGQFWQLFGWQSYYHPNTVQIQGLPAQVFSRTPQARLSHLFKSEAISVEAAVAAARPPQRDSGVPDGQAGVRILVNGRKALHTTGGAGTSADPLGIGVSGVVRQFVLPELVAAPVATRSASGWGISVDGLLPLIPGTTEDRANALTLTGSYVKGSGIADLYTGLTGGIAAPAYPAPAAGATVVAPIDAGLVAFDAAGVLHSIDWSSYMVGLQYYLPPAGKVWIALNYSHMGSANIAQFAAPASVFTKSDWGDGNLFWDLTPAVRFGLEYALFRQTRGDGQSPQDQRVQFSSWFIF